MAGLRSAGMGLVVMWSGRDQLSPLSMLREYTISGGPRGPLARSQTTIHVPCPSVATRGCSSITLSVAGLGLTGAGGVQVAPLSVLRALRISKFVPAPPMLLDSQTAIQTPL